jgi:hypothetical protein
MRSTSPYGILKTVILAVTVLLLTASASYAQVGLTARPSTTTLPDGRMVQMWGLFCASPSNLIPTSGPTCSALDGTSQNGVIWQPPLIRVQTGTTLTISLTNNLPLPPGAAAGTGIPTSLMIVGQLGGGLGAAPTRVDSPIHAIQGPTWPIAADTSHGSFTPPAQGQRVRSFGTEVAQGATTSLTWSALKAGTYLIESGTYPSIQGPMGLYGVLIVSDSATVAYPGVTYDKDVPLLLSEIDADQNAAVAAAVATSSFSETGTRVIRESVSAVSLSLDVAGNVANAGTGYHVNDPIAFTGGGFSVTATAHVSGVDVNGAITAIVVDNPGSGYSSIPTVTVTRTSGIGVDAQVEAALSLAGVLCSDGAAACYPPAVNYDPRYYLMNGLAFDKTNPGASTFAGPGLGAAATTGNVLLRLVNAGLRTHIPSVVGLNLALIAEDGNLQPDVALAISKNLTPQPKTQSEVFLPAGKVYDVMLHLAAPNAPYAKAAYPVFDRQLSLSTNNQRDGGMQGYISVNGGSAPLSGLTAVANPDSYFLLPGKTVTVSDPAKGVIANDINVYGVSVLTPPSGGTLSLHFDGTFTYVPNTGTTSDTFVYQANGNPLLQATVTLSACTGPCLGGAPTAMDDAFTSRIASRMQVSVPGVLGNDKDPQGHPLTVDPLSVVADPGLNVAVSPDGAFIATAIGAGSMICPTGTPAGASCFRFQYQAVNSQGSLSTAVDATNTPHAGKTVVTLAFLKASGVTLVVKDAKNGAEITDYRWIVEEDRTFRLNPATQVNAGANVPSIGTSFHTSYMPVIAAGCVGAVACESGQTVVDPSTGAHNPAVCDIGNGVCRTTGTQQVPVTFDQVSLDPNKYYYVSILPGDAGNSFTAGAGAPGLLNPSNPNGPSRPFNIDLDCGPYSASSISWAPGTGTCGHTMGGAPLAPGKVSVSVLLPETPLPTAKIAVLVFEDDNPLNGEHDAGGGVDILAPNEPGLGGFEITLFDDAGGTGDATGQMTYDMFNMPLSNSLANTIDPLTGLDACPISPKSKDGLVGMIVTCPKFESDGITLSPLAGQALIANMMPGRYGVVATPGADRIARGEEWLQTNTLDGQKPHDSFIKVGGPGYFQEFGPAGYHVSVGFANPAIINARKPAVCANQPCTSSVSGTVTDMRISRSPDQRLYSSGSHDALSFTQCYVSLGDHDGENFAFTKCNPDGTFSLTGIPAGTWRIVILDQWNDTINDGLSTPVALAVGQAFNMGDIPVLQWHTNLSTTTYFDSNGNGVRDAVEDGLTLVPTNIRFRDGSYSNFNNTDLNGNAGFNEIFPLFNWYVVEADTTRYKQTGVHVVYDAGGPADGTLGGGNSNIAGNLANTLESPTAHLPTNLRVPGAVYCGNADCTGFSIKNGPASSATNPSTGRIDPPWVTTEGWQGFLGQYSFIEFGKAPFATGENGGIKGEVIYASTRPFDDPALLIHTSWTPDVPGVTINLYQEGTAADGTQSLTLVDTTKTSSWDDWAQGFRSDGVPNMNCPGQETTSPFYFTLRDSTQWLNPSTLLPSRSQFKCFDGMIMFNQVQPAPYDGMYKFPSVAATSPTTGKPTATNCKICTPNPIDGLPMLPKGKYVVEMVVPPGYELVKEEDKNILIGDNYIAPVTQQFGGLGSIFILPDQAEVNGQVNPFNPQNPTNNLGSTPRHEGDTGSIEQFWPCVGQLRVVPDYISLFPQSKEVSPFAGASRHLCDRKEVTLEDQTSVLAKFWVFSSTHVAAHFTGIITDDFSSEFDPFSPQFGEKFAVPNLPISIKDFAGNEVSRIYSDQWGFYNGLNYSTWEVNPPNPTGYAPTMMVTCMNDPGPIPDPLHPGQMITDPLYNSNYSQFCYEIPFMPGQTQYMDTPVVPTSAFAEGYNPPDCAYPDTTPAIKQVDGDGVGPWVAGPDGGNAVASVTLTNAGSGYRLPPAVSFSGGAGNGAAASATLRVNSVTLSNRGSGYTSPPSVSFSGGAGSGAAVTVTMRVGSLTVTNAGLRYTSVPAVTFSNTGTGGFGASATATMRVSQIVLSSGGSGYTSAPTVTISLPGGTCTPAGVRATATATISGGSVTSITITNQGSCYNSRPTVSFSGGGGTGAAAANSTTTGTFMSVNAIAVGSVGTGYISQPGVTIGAAPSGGTTATATAFLVVDIINITASGLGYTAAPSVIFSGPPSGVTAVGSATMSVNAITMTAGGLGYTSTPSVSFNNSGTSGSGAAATATLGPSVASHRLTITALGDQVVPNHGYSGPQATTPPFNQKFITRHYGFGATQGTGSVTIAGVNAPVVSWSDSQIVVTVPSVPAAQSTCTIPQPGVTGVAAANYRCGELVITAGNGKKSIDTVTVNVGGKPPTHINGENAANNAVQTAIDNATPGDLIILGPGAYTEMLIMWKPIRLQGVAAASVTINANAHPSGKLDPWRRQVLCLFGMALNGQPVSSTNPFDSNPANPFVCTASMLLQTDRIEKEGVLSWDTTVNGNLAQLLQEPTLMGAYEGAGITVLAKGVRYPVGVNPFPITNAAGEPIEGQFPDGTLFLTNSAQDCSDYAGNFLCGPSRIDGLSVTNSSQGGGGIFVHGWAHNLEISNNRVYSNAGTLTGGVTIGQGEFSDPIVVDADVFNNAAVAAGQRNPGYTDPTIIQPNRPIPPGTPSGTQLAYGLNKNVQVHHNYITQNASFGDELFSATPAGGGGATFCTGSDHYHFNYNWVCGNLSSGDGAGLVHLGFSYNGDISHNWVLFNQSTNPTIPTYGGGIAVYSTAPDAPVKVKGVVTENECGSVTDADCGPGLSDGTGPGLVIDSNLIMGNSAESGSGGGLRLQIVNGDEISRFPLNPENWYSVTVMNNIIANNVAGWDGGGVSLQDALVVNFINNTVVANDTTASSGMLFNTIGAINASVPPPGCDPSSGVGCTNPVVTSAPQAAGLVTMRNTSNLTSSFPAVITCPADHPNCRQISYPLLRNNLFWQNRPFNITVGGFGPGILNQQHLVTLVPTLNQPSTGACVGGAASWDIGVRGDTGPANHASGFTLSPRNSILSTLTGGYGGNGNIAPPSPGVIRQYCNGSRVAPENGGFAFNAEPGVAGTVIPNPVFNLTPAATVDEGNNWINLEYGPLSLSSAAVPSGAAAYGVPLGNYAIVQGSPAISAASSSSAPNHDFLGNPRPSGGGFDIGAVQFVASSAFVVNPTSVVFNPQPVGTTGAAQIVTVTNTGNVAVTGISVSIGGTNPTNFARSGGSCGTSLAIGLSCTINVTFTPSAASLFSATLSVSATGANTAIVTLSGIGGGPVVSVLPTSLTFALQPVGTTSAAQTVTVSNTGNAPLTAFSATFGGTNPTNFARAAGDTCGTTLAAGASCTINVTFTPSATGARSATLSVSGTGTNTAIVTLSGTGAGPVVGVLPASLTFASQAVGTTSAIQTVTVSNTGNAPLTAISATFGGTNPTNFARAAGDTCGTTLAAGASCTINVTFTPSAVGAQSATLSVSGAGANTAIVTLSGTGAGPVVGVSPASLAYAARLLGTTSPAQTVTVSNTGNAPLTAISATFGGTNPTNFARGAGDTCGTTLAAGASCTINVTFTPSATGVQSATLSVSGAAPANTAIVALSGTGSGPVVGVSPTSLTFAPQLVPTTSAAQTVTVSNTGTATLTTISVSFGGTNPTNFARAGGTCGANLATGSSCTITVTFTPSALGAQSATMSVSGAAPANTATVTLSGTGTTVSASPASLTFATQLVATTSPAQTVTVSNSGATPVTPFSVTFGGTNPTNFARAGGTCGTSLAAASSCTVTVTFTPSASGAQSATLSVGGAAPETTATVALTGTGTLSSGIVQAQLNSASATSVTSLSVPFGAVNTAGNLIIAFVRMSTTSQTVAITDSHGNPYVQAVAAVQSTDGSQVRLFYARNILGGANTVTATFSGTNTHPWLAIYEYSGLSTTSPLDQTASASGGGTAASSGATLLATTSANELVFAGLGLPSSYAGAPTAGNLFIIMQSQAGAGTSQAANESKLVTATGTQTGTFTLSTSAFWSAVVATFKP